MLSTRILTAIVGIPLIFSCVYFGGIYFFALMFVVSFFCVYEYLSITAKYNPYKIPSLILSSLFFISLIYLDAFIGAFVILFILFAVEVFGKNTEFCIQRISVSFLGAFFLPFTFMYMCYLREFENFGMRLIFFIFIVVWVLDTAAYAFGKLFGKHKLAPNVSPKKTVEGAVAGVIFGIITSIVCKIIFIPDALLGFKETLILGFVISVVGQFSDLAESLIKRDGNIKDSGKMIPGHGGFLDRFDSYIFAAPAAYYCVLLLHSHVN
ncbi:MAG: phosphatidate cytidylyltransferase [Endomicrobium sp.]|jgi:phosphatidate cytidylyltransferase|nr:phosphatidate cytidylyltransferase [Endomicrobium sp.]